MTAYTMPPQTPFDASPTGMVPSPGMLIVATGIPLSNVLLKRNPDVLGKNPGTRPLSMQRILPRSYRNAQ